jgi:hypothetical protein
MPIILTQEAEIRRITSQPRQIVRDPIWKIPMVLRAGKWLKLLRVYLGSMRP